MDLACIAVLVRVLLHHSLIPSLDCMICHCLKLCQLKILKQLEVTEFQKKKLFMDSYAVQDCFLKLHIEKWWGPNFEKYFAGIVQVKVLLHRSLIQSLNYRRTHVLKQRKRRIFRQLEIT